MRSRLLAACLLVVGFPSCCVYQAAADRDAMRRGLCWQQLQLSQPAPVDPYGDPLTGERLEQRRALVNETIERLDIDCGGFAP